MKKGFTLIEMLAIIIILGIICVIATGSIKNVMRDSRLKAFEATVSQVHKAVSAECKLEKLDKEKITSLYTIIDGKIDNGLVIKGKLPDSGYVLVQDNCKMAYTFYNEDNVISKNFSENDDFIYNYENTPAYGLEWRSNKTTPYTRTLDAADIDDNSVNVQDGDTPVTNAFDELDIYKDILPYTDEFGNEFMLIPKFYISKTKEVADAEVIWNYAVSKQKLDDTYYLPSNFVDEGIDNDKHIELPYVLVGKYEAGSNGKSGSEEMLVSKSGIIPKVNMTINTARDLATRYNDIEGVSGYQQYDIHVQDLLNILFAIEFKTMNSQNVMRGYVDKTWQDSLIVTGGSDNVESSSGTLSNDGHQSFNYRGIENLWGNVWSYVEGVNIDQINGTKDSIYTAVNARHYSSDNITEYYTKLAGYKKLNSEGYISESGFDANTPFVNLPTKIGGDYVKGVGDYYYENLDPHTKIVIAGGSWAYGNSAGMNIFFLRWSSSFMTNYVGTRILKTPMLTNS